MLYLHCVIYDLLFFLLSIEMSLQIFYVSACLLLAVFIIFSNNLVISLRNWKYLSFGKSLGIGKKFYTINLTDAVIPF